MKHIYVAEQFKRKSLSKLYQENNLEVIYYPDTGIWHFTADSNVSLRTFQLVKKEMEILYPNSKYFLD